MEWDAFYLLFPADTPIQQYTDQVPTWEIQTPVERLLHSRRMQNRPPEAGWKIWDSFLPQSLGMVPHHWVETPSSQLFLGKGRKEMDCISNVLTFPGNAQKNGFYLAWIWILTRMDPRLKATGSKDGTVDLHACTHHNSHLSTALKKKKISSFSLGKKKIESCIHVPTFSKCWPRLLSHLSQSIEAPQHTRVFHLYNLSLKNVTLCILDPSLLLHMDS